jgi:outer membrane protein assembly factor BamB
MRRTLVNPMTHGCGRIFICLSVPFLLDGASAQAQGRGGQIWTTTGGDAARSASVRIDPRISKESVAAPAFQLLWKRPLENRAGLTQPVFSAPGFITYKGFKALAYVGSSSDNVFAIDYDLNRIFWTRKLTDAAPASVGAACPGRLMAITETTALPPSASAARDAAPAGRGGGGGGFGGGGGRGAVAALYAVSSAGMLHSMNLQDGTDWFPPARILPGANARMTGSILANSVLYVATADNCGGVPNGVYAMDLTPRYSAVPGPDGLPVPPNAIPGSTDVARWETHGGSVVGSGPALGPDGTVYVATADGAYSDKEFSNSVVALEPKTLAQKDFFTPGRSAFTSSPIVFEFNGRDLVAAANSDGHIYVLDAKSLGGSDHKTPLAAFEPGSSAGQRITGLATAELNGTRWLVCAVTWLGAPSTPKDFLAAGQLRDQDGKILVNRGWIAPQVLPQATPAIVNGVVFGLSAGLPASAGAAASPATLYAIDLTTGKDLWNSGSSITSPAVIGPAVDDSQVYVATTDGTLYTFGFHVER